MVEHVSACEQEDSDQTDGRPEISVLNNRQDIRPGHAHEGYQAEYDSGDDNDPDVVDGPDNRGLWAVWQVPRNPRVYLLCRLWASV